MDPYEPNVWKKGDRASATKFNRLEEAVETLSKEQPDSGTGLTPEQSQRLANAIVKTDTQVDAAPDKVVLRDSNGRFLVMDPVESSEPASKGYVDANAGGLTPEQSERLNKAVTTDDTSSSATAGKVVLRDANGRFKAASPSADGDVATKLYVDQNKGGLTAEDRAKLDGALQPEDTDPGAVAGMIPIRDSNGRFQVAAPSADLDVATKKYVDDKPAGGLTPEQSARLNKAITTDDVASAPTASKVVIRDANGRFQAAAPSADSDVSTKGYADGKVQKSAATAGQAFVKDGNGNTAGLGYDTAAAPSTLAQRNSSGQVVTAAPTADTHAATKKYVDDNKGSGGGTVSTRDYVAKQTAGITRATLDELVRKALHRSTQFVRKFTDVFTGTNGAAPSSTNYTIVKPSGSTIDIQSNALRLLTPATAWMGGLEVFTKGFKGQDIDASMTYTYSTTYDTYDCFYLRTTTADLSNEQRPYTGYGVQINPKTGAFDFMQGTNVFKGGQTVVMPAGVTTARVRLRFLEQTFYFKIWDPAQTEPEAWDFVITDIDIDTNWGTFTFVHGNGGTANATTAILDNLILAAAVPPLLPALSTAVPAGAVGSRLYSGGNIWKLAYKEDFTRNAALGQMRTVYSEMGYSTEEEGDTAFNTTGGRKSANKTMSVTNGILDVYQHIESGTPYGAFFMPDNYTPHTYGRYAIRFKTAETTPGQGGYKFVPLMWPSSNDWNEGEIDWPESNIGEFPRPASAVPGSYNTVKPNTMDFRPLAELFAHSDMTDWHIAEMEWSPGAIRFYWDGILVTTVTDAVPTKPMRFTVQAETWLNGAVVPSGAAAHVSVDWIAIWDLETQTPAAGSATLTE